MALTISLQTIAKVVLVVFAAAMVFFSAMFSTIPFIWKATLAGSVLVAIAVAHWLFTRRDPEGRSRRFVIRLFALTSAALLTRGILGVAIDAQYIGADGWVRLAAGSGPTELFVGLLLALGVLRVVMVPAMPFESESTELSLPPPTPETLPEVDPPPTVLFWERVVRLFHARANTDYRIRPLNESGYCVGTYTDDMEGESLVLIACDEGADDVDEHTVAAFDEYRQALGESRGQPVRRAFFVTAGDRRAGDRLRERFSELQFRSERQLVDGVVNFVPYLHSLVHEYAEKKLPYSLSDSERTLEGTYVSPRFDAADRDGEEGLVEYLDRWLKERGGRQISISADYGMGKSSFMKHYAAVLARRRLTELDGRTDLDGRVPILVSLTGRSPRNRDGLLAQITVAIGGKEDALPLLMASGRLVFLLDGFDEMDLLGGVDDRRAHFDALWKRLETWDNKIIFTGRGGYFATDAERRRALRIVDADEARLIGRSHCSDVRLTGFDEPQIRESFEKYFSPEEATRHFNTLSEQQALLDLARRPALMHIIREQIDTLGEKLAGLRMRGAQVLRSYTEHWIVREEEKENRRLLVEPEDRRRFVRELAAKMFALGKTRISSDELAEMFHNTFPDYATKDQKGFLEGIESDLRTCTFLIPAEGDGFEFAHKSFFEVLFADWIVTRVNADEPIPAATRSREWSREIIRHVVDLYEVGQESGAQWRPLYSGIASGRSRDGLLLHLMAFIDRFGPHTSQRNAVQAMIYAKVEWSKVCRWAWIPISASPFVSLLSQVQPGHLRNAVRRSSAALARVMPEEFSDEATGEEWSTRWKTLARALLQLWILVPHPNSHQQFRRLDLAAAHLENCDFSQFDMSSRNLAHANLTNGTLRDTILVESNLSDARLLGASLRRATLTLACFDGANLTSADMRDVIAIATQFRGGDLQSVDLRGANLDLATLEEANLVNANLGGATLRRARLDRSILTRAALQGADLRGCSLVDADLRGTALEDTTLLGAKYSKGTRFPEGFDPEDAGLEKVTRAPEEPA